MQSNKTSSRKPKTAAIDGAGQTPDATTKAPAAKARKTSPSSKKEAATEMASTTHRRKAATATPKTMAAASAGGSYVSETLESGGNSIQSTTIEPTHAEVEREDVAALAHSYWVERGHRHGSHDDDWIRAEQELKARR